MKTLSLSEAKMKLSHLVESVNKTSNEVVITKNGKPAAVLISPDELEGWRETIAILSDKDFVSEIQRGLKQLKSGQHKTYSLSDLNKLLED